MAVPYRLRALRPNLSPTTEEALGPRVRVFRTAAHRQVIWAAVPFGLLLAYVVWLGNEGLLLRWFNSGFSVGAVSTLFVLAIALIVFTATVGGAEAVALHADGIRDVRAQPRSVRWDEIRSLVAVCGPSGDVLHHVLRTEDGGAVALGPAIGDVDALLDEIRVRVTERKADALEARLAAGGCVRFGAIEARSPGLVFRGEALPWGELGAIEAEGGAIILRTRAGEVWGRVSLAEVPNAFLLAEIGDRRAARSRAVES